MKTLHPRSRRSIRGYALLIVMVFLGISLLLLMTIMNWTSETSRLTDRNNEYYTTAGAAEAATEKILVRMSRDYLSGGEAAVISSLPTYKTIIPVAADAAYWGNYTFNNPLDGSTGTYVIRATNWQYTVLDAQYTGLFGFQATYRILSNAKLDNSRNGNLVAAVEQDIGLQSIPIFQFAIFYNTDLEMCPSPPMVVTGRVHANGNIYALPSASLTFMSDVTASGFITNTFMPGDPNGNRGISNPDVIFDAAHDGGTSTLNLPIGTNNTSSAVNQILQPPPTGESRSSSLGESRLYNQADLIITITDTNGVTVSSGPELPGTPVTLSSNAWSQFLVDTNIIYNERESQYVRTTQIDIAQFGAWVNNSTNPITPMLQAKPAINIVYVNDQRTSQAQVGTKTVNGKTVPVMAPVEPGVELVHGQQLPKAGLTIATPDPVYVDGNYNTTSDGVNFSQNANSTTYTQPAAIMGDSINILSQNWQNTLAYSQGSLSGPRVAIDTTVNAAFLAGIVPTGNGFYSGGVENYPRFLENWSGKTFWYNGSMVVMFDSQITTAPWGSNGNTYNPPTRKWAFDTNFLNVAKLPPGTPQILNIERLTWAFQKPGFVPL